MSSFAQRVRSAARNPEMLPLYAKWLACRAVGARPAVTFHGCRLSGFGRFNVMFGAWRDLPSPAEARLVERTCSSGDVLDIGANFGAFTMLVARSCPAATVHAFEPVPGTFEHFVRNMAANDLYSVIPNNVAVGLEPGMMSFTDTADPAVNRKALDGDPCTIDVPVTSIDEYAKDMNVALAKIDVEGMEPMVLRGAERALRGNRIAVGLIEICPDNLARFGFGLVSIQEPLRRAGYELRVLSPDGSPGRIFRDADAAGGYVNAVFVPT